MKKNISINLQGLIFHIEEDGYDVLSRYLLEVKAHFATYQGHQEIVADIEGRIAELFAARTSASKQVITLADVEEMTAKMGRVSDFQAADEDEDEPAQARATGAAAGPTPTPAGSTGPTAASGPRSLYRDLAHRKIAGVAAGLAQYFQVNPLWIRLGFLALVLLPGLIGGSVLVFGRVDGHWRGPDLGGLAVLTYVILWIVLPKRLDAPTPIDTIASSGPLAGRKLFGDTDTGKVGGVAAGLAAYFRTDVVLIRVLLLLSLFLGGSGFLLYVILWIVVPEARSVSEKMQMRGDAVTLSGIDNSLRATAFEGDGAAGAGLGGASGGRPVGAFLESAARGARPAVSFVGSLIRWGVAGGLLFTAGVLLVSLAAALGDVLGILPSHTVQLGDEQSTYFLLHDLRPWMAICGFLALAIPTLAFGLLGLRLLLRRPVLGRTANLSLVGVYLLSLIGSGVAVAQVVREFREQGTYTNVRRLAPVPGRGIVLAVREQDANLRDVRLRLAPADSGAAPFVEEEYRANGASRDAARLTAQQTTQYAITQQDSTITFDEGLMLRENAPFRAQRLNLTLHLPLDKTYRLTPRFVEKLNGGDFVGGRRPDDDQPHRARLTRGGKFRLLDGLPASASADSGDEDTSSAESSTDANGEEVVNFNVNGNKTQLRVNTDGDSPSIRLVAGRFSQDPASYGTGRKTLTDPGTFTEVESRGALRVVVRRGDTYRVEAAGRPRDLERLRLGVSGDRLSLRSTGNDDGGLLSGFGLGGRPVLVTVTLPHLRHLDLSGACQADLRGFREDELRLEASGASSIRLTDAQLTRLNLDLSGACSTELSGTATELGIDANGASQVQALGLQAQRANLDLSGISQASVRVSEELTADLSGTSRVRYAGQPRINQDLSGTSRLEQVK